MYPPFCAQFRSEFVNIVAWIGSNAARARFGTSVTHNQRLGKCNKLDWEPRGKSLMNHNKRAKVAFLRMRSGFSTLPQSEWSQRTRCDDGNSGSNSGYSHIRSFFRRSRSVVLVAYNRSVWKIRKSFQGLISGEKRCSFEGHLRWYFFFSQSGANFRNDGLAVVAGYRMDTSVQ